MTCEVHLMNYGTSLAFLFNEELTTSNNNVGFYSEIDFYQRFNICVRYYFLNVNSLSTQVIFMLNCGVDSIL